MLRIAVLCAVFVLARGQTTSVSQCILNQGGLPLNSFVEGCITPPCQLPQLQDVVVNVIFRSPRVLSSMRTLATATVNFGFPITIPYDLGQNAVTCNFFTNTYCPLLPGEIVEYRLRMFIEPFFPVGTQATIEFRIVDTSTTPNEAIWCIRLPILIVPPLTASKRQEIQTDHVIV